MGCHPALPTRKARCPYAGIPDEQVRALSTRLNRPDHQDDAGRVVHYGRDSTTAFSACARIYRNKNTPAVGEAPPKSATIVTVHIALRDRTPMPVW